MNMLTRQQRWAQHAFKLVNEHINKTSETEQKKYRSLARSFPALVHECGLVQAVAFLQVSGKSERDALLKHLEEISDTQLAIDSKTKEESYLKLSSYLHLSQQVLAAASWLKRYAEALILEPEGKNADGK